MFYFHFLFTFMNTAPEQQRSARTVRMEIEACTQQRDDFRAQRLPESLYFDDAILDLCEEYERICVISIRDILQQ
ncbi:MAG: hypothetical protein Greene041662_159 [Candidatus Peregrinibacteria bacterium Greene0416_62]|nr:MAG: hypothetical protein Greene041662_159 [Candidatus Peregrinibacteria bacterium Greene0416_62]TSD00760.1 MAG: hypothetical protein Greene101449_23 [Candidatus Peregrinibacteria bacterium Greene1014_49]